MNSNDFYARLSVVLEPMGPVAVAVSGGVDSLTLAAAAHELFADRFMAYHALSPAVPPRATERTERLARRRGWPLQIFYAGEFDDEQYLANPVDRCYHCKSSLYGRIGELTDLQVVSGTNTDDLSDYRPGLVAADEHEVRHPFVEALIDKEGIRSLARSLGLGSVAELPAAPCLSSRLQTGISVTPTRLRLIDEVEERTRQLLSPATVRCRIFAERVEIQLDPASLDRVQQSEDLADALVDYLAVRQSRPVEFTRYSMGSSVVRSDV